MHKRNTDRWLACVSLAALLALGASPAGAQTGGPPQKKAKSQLEEWLERSARSHPDIKVAEAKLRTAAAELERARAQVMQQVLSLHYAIEAQKIAMVRAESEIARLNRLVGRGAASKEDLDKARSDLIAAKAKLSELQAQLNHMVGKEDAHKAAVDRVHLRLRSPTQGIMDFDNDGFMDLEIVRRRQAPRGPVAERLRKALNQSLALTAQERSLAEVLDMIRRQQPDLIIQVKAPVELTHKLSMKFTDLSLGAALQLLEDNLPGQRIVVREYGLLIAPEKAVPLGALPLVEFWKGGDKPKK